MATTTQAMAGNGNATTCKCDWKGCSGNPHETQVKYNDKKNGSVTRGKYIGNWPAPYCMQTSSYQDFGVLDGSFQQLKSTKYTKVKTSCRDLYTIEFHHVVPVDAIKSMANLKKNLVLLGWNINDGLSNGMCLPYFKEDQIWHYLQPHRGEHPKSYINDVKAAIKPINSKCAEYCQLSEKEKTDKAQETLITNIAKTVDQIRNGILNWNIKIHLKDTLTNWKSLVFSRKTGTARGYFKNGDTVSSTPPEPRKPHTSRKYIE